MKWLRLYSDLLYNPKVQGLPAAMFKHWVNTLCYANLSSPRGVVPSVEHLALALRVKPGKAKGVAQYLESKNLIHQSEDGSIIIHDWDVFQKESDDVTPRVRKHREQKNNTETSENDENETNSGTTSVQTASNSGNKNYMSVTQHERDLVQNETSEQKENNNLDNGCNVTETPQNRIDKNREDNKDNDKSLSFAEKNDETEKKKQNQRKKPLTDIPPDFCLNAKMIKHAEKQGVTDVRWLADFTDYFANKAPAGGYRYADWEAGWRTWLKNSIERGKAPTNNALAGTANAGQSYPQRSSYAGDRNEHENYSRCNSAVDRAAEARRRFERANGIKPERERTIIDITGYRVG